MKKKAKKKIFTVILFSILGAIILWGVAGFFLFSNKQPADNIYVSPENPKQGDTVFIKVTSNSSKVAGNFGQEKLAFFEKGKSSEWISFLGIDADQQPGNYSIFVSTSNGKDLIKKIKVGLASFSSAPTTALANNQGGYSAQKAVDNILKNDNPVLKNVFSKLTPQPYFTAPFSDPLSKIQVSGFSFGKFLSLAKYKIQHLGVDLRAKEDTEIYAVNDGKVVLTANLSNYGKTVVIDHGADIFSMYLHLDKFEVANGDMVRRGQAIGLSGETGYASGPHLHFSMRVGTQNSRVDPITFIATSQKMNDNLTLASIAGAALSFFIK